MRIPGFSAKPAKSGGMPTPVAFVDDAGLVLGHNRQAWLWHKLESRALVFASEETKAHHAKNLSTMFEALGRTSRGGMVKGSSVGSDFREFHLIGLSWTEDAAPSPETPDVLRKWQEHVLAGVGAGHGLFAVGVRLRSGASLIKASLNPVEIAKSITRQASGDAGDMTRYTADRAEIATILSRAGSVPCTAEDVRRLELWWKGGDHRGGDCLIALPDGRSLAGDAWQHGNLEISAMAAYEEMLMEPDAMWIAGAFSHPSQCVAVSVRGTLTPPKLVRDKMRRAQRKGLSRQEEQARTGDLARAEDEEMFAMAQHLEETFRQESAPLATDLSVLMAREADPSQRESYIDFLENRHGVLMKPAEHRQMSALLEMIPCGERVIGTRRPFVQDCTTAVLAEAGFGSMSAIGDRKGLFIGVAPPDSPLVWLDPDGASASDKPATMAVLGDSGSGKTVFLQLLATQAALWGKAVIMVNPKPADTLAEFAAAIGGTTVMVGVESAEPGQLDPFRFAEPSAAAAIASSYISTALSDVIPKDAQLYMDAVMQRAAKEDDARCVGDCIRHPEFPAEAAQAIRAKVEGRPVFGLGIAWEPLPKLAAAQAGLTLIEFERALPIPPTVDRLENYESDVRIAVGVVRLVMQAAMEQMLARGEADSGPRGGVLIIDEAHVLMGSEEGRRILERLGREGRSQRVLPVLATQRVADVTEQGADLGSYLSRVVCLKMADQREAQAALDLLGMDVTDDNVKFLAHAGPRRAEEHSEGLPARGYHKDLQGRCSMLAVAPLPPDVLRLFSTNPTDRKERAAERQAQAVAPPDTIAVAEKEPAL